MPPEMTSKKKERKKETMKLNENNGRITRLADVDGFVRGRGFSVCLETVRRRAARRRRREFKEKKKKANGNDASKHGRSGEKLRLMSI